MRNAARSLINFAILGCLLGCTKTLDPTSSIVSVKMPDADSESGKPLAKLTGYDFTRACFAISVKGPELTRPAASCEVPLGVFKGFAEPGTEVSLSVPRGTGRTLEIFSYMRDSASEPCKSQADFGTLSRAKLVRVATHGPFDSQQAEVALDVTITAPASATQNIVSQYGMQNSCAPPPPPPASSSTAVAMAHARTNGGDFGVEGTVSAQTNQMKMQGGNFQMQLNRRRE